MHHPTTLASHGYTWPDGPTTRDLDTARNVLSRTELFDGVTGAPREAAMSRLQRMHFTSGRRVFFEGEPGDRMFIIVEGKVKLGRSSGGGRENLLAVMGPSDIFGELAVFDPGPRGGAAPAVTDVRALMMDRVALQAWCADDPDIYGRLLRLVARRVRHTTDAYVDMVSVDVPGRVAKTLLLLGERFGIRTAAGLLVDHGLTQGELAQLVGAARETVSKALAEFERRGWIRLDVGTTLITDTAHVARRAGVETAWLDPSSTHRPPTPLGAHHGRSSP